MEIAYLPKPPANTQRVLHGASRTPPPTGGKRKSAFVSNKRQRRINLCGTTLVPVFTGTRQRVIGRKSAQPTQNLSVRCSEVIQTDSCLLPYTNRQLSGSGALVYVSSSSHFQYGSELTCSWDRSCGRTAGSGWQTCWWWSHWRWGAWEPPWERYPRWCPRWLRCSGRSRQPHRRC